MATFISLNQYDLVEVAGVDAEKYLQGQLTCDVVHLAAGASTLTAHCDPKGKMNSLFRLIKLSAEQFLILMPKALLAPLDHLKKYAVFSKVTFQVLDWQIVGLIGEKCGHKCRRFYNGSVSVYCNVLKKRKFNLIHNVSNKK